ncbi:MAG: 30S ribosomal protein S18 [Candidatus Magasanikbacteria bacterium]|nr:30S ribosomal protein S18 [Candidatus Magasanikbacteria bacterium]
MIRETVKEQLKACHFCVQNIKQVALTDTGLLRRFVSSYMKISPRRRSGLCAKHQRVVSRTVRQARAAGLMPFISR